MAEAAQQKFKRDLNRFEQSVKEMQTCLRSLNESASQAYGEALPRAKEFQRGLQDEITLVDNLVGDMQGVGDQLRRYNQQYDCVSDSSVVASANRASEFITMVLGAFFKGQNIFFSESSKVSQVLLDIVCQTKHKATPREARLTRELQDKLADGKRVKTLPVGRLPKDLAAPAFRVPAGGHRGPGALIGGAYGSPKPESRGPTAQIKPASRFSAQPSTHPVTNRIFV